MAARSFAGWLALAAALALAAGGAAARPGGVLLGLPSPAAAGAVVVAVLGLASWVGWERGALALGLWPLALVALSGLVPPLTGPPLLGPALGATAALLAGRRLRTPRWLFLPAVFALYVIASARVQVQVGPRGDEPHYLMVADSLLRDGDVSLERDYAEARYGAFADGPLAPHYRVRGKHGEIYSLHALGLSLLVLPAYALGGYPAASFFMALLAALLAREIRELLRLVTGRDDLADGVGWTIALSPPLIHYAGLVFSEVPAALLVAVALRRAREPGLAAGLAIALLPWLNVRYAPLALLLLAYASWPRPRLRNAIALIAPVAVSALASAAYHYALYGFFDPRRVYGRRPEISMRTLPEGLPGLLLDQEFGLLIYAPVFALALPGLVALGRKDRRPAVVAVALTAAAVLTAGTWHMWRGGWNPPARFLVPLLPVLALAVAAALARGLSAGAALLIGWGLWTGLGGAWEPRLVHRDRDGTAPFFRAYSGAEEWTRLLPGYVLGEPDRSRLALAWAAVLAAAALRRRSPVTAPRLAAASLGLAAAAVVASTLSSARTGGRDAVRLVGRPALAVPGLSWIGSAEARWGPAALEWGPLYEPHRHPDGAPVGVRLPLPPGSYRLTLRAEDLSSGKAPPRLEIRPDGPAPARRAHIGEEFEVRPGDRAVTLLLRSGGPLVLEELNLSAATRSKPLNGGVLR